MRPLWFEFPEDPLTFGSHASFLLGSSILVTPVTTQGQTTTSVYLPTTPEGTSRDFLFFFLIFLLSFPPFPHVWEFLSPPE